MSAHLCGCTEPATCACWCHTRPAGSSETEREPSWWDKIPEDERAFVAIMLGVCGLMAFIFILAAL